jgi:transposase InsO family protein
VKYTPEVRTALEKLWRRFGRVCGKRLVVILRHSLPYLDDHPGLGISPATRTALSTISAATVDRLLCGARKREFLRGTTHTKPVSALCSSIPIRTFSEWEGVPPGHLQMDLVGHDGGISSGEFCFTLSLTDVCTGWTERRALLAKAARWVKEALEEIRNVLPFPIIELHPDNGSEFINRTLVGYCRDHGYRLTRSRSGRKNDNCYVEQKNFDTVRKLVGYYRFSGRQAVDTLNELYRTHGPLQNLVYPSQKLLSKERIGASVHKHHGRPLSPADRLLARKDIGGRTRWNIHAARQDLDPITLAENVARIQRKVFALAKRSPDSSEPAQGTSA